MHRKTKNRLYLTILSLGMVSFGVFIILYNLQQNIIFFYPPSKINEAKITSNIRVGGLVKKDSIIKTNQETIKFIITDNIAELTVEYRGITPALFREGQGIVARGTMRGDIFEARELLTKHDENYRPPEI